MNLSRTAGMAIAALSLTLLTACQSSSMSHGSRVEIYGSMDELLAGSGAVVVGTVTEQYRTKDVDGVTEFTLSEVSVSENIANERIGTAMPEGTPRLDTSEGTTITVRQMGNDSMESPPAEILRYDETYLLFVRPSRLDGDLGKQFYVAGVSAGIYQQGDGEGSALVNQNRFAHYGEIGDDTIPDYVDIIPDAINIGDVDIIDVNIGDIGR